MGVSPHGSDVRTSSKAMPHQEGPRQSVTSKDCSQQGPLSTFECFVQTSDLVIWQSDEFDFLFDFFTIAHWASLQNATQSANLDHHIQNVHCPVQSVVALEIRDML